MKPGNPCGAKGCRKVETLVTKPMEIKPGAVPERDIRDGELLFRWNWVEPTVWTLRMLMALESGVKGGKWFSLIDKVNANEEAFDFLGYRFTRGKRYPRPKSMQKLKDPIRAKTKRNSGE